MTPITHQDIENCLATQWNKKENKELKTGIDIEKVANLLLRDTNIVTILETHEVRYYVDGVYSNFGRDSLEKTIEAYWGAYTSDKTQANLLTTHVVEEIINKIKRKTLTPMECFDTDRNVINMNNGLFHIDTEELKPHDPKYLSLIQIPTNYDPQAVCPNIEEVLKRVFKQKDKKKILQFVGYCLWREYKIQKAFLLIGPGSSGKSRLLDIIRALVGPENCSEVSFEEIADDTFAIADFHQKLVNLCGDLDIVTIRKTGEFKRLTGGSTDRVRAQKKFGQPFEFVNFAKLAFSTNGLSKVDDTSSGFFRRLELIEADHVFTPNPADEPMLKAIVSPPELSGLFNLVIPELKELLKNLAFDSQRSTEETEALYNKLSDPTSQFLEKCIIDAPEVKVLKSDVMDAYTQYCKRCGKTAKPQNNIAFGASLRKAFPHVENAPIQKDGKTHPAFKGIRLDDTEVAKLKYL